MELALAKLDKATKMLAEAKTLDEVKQIIDIAEAARTYAKAAKLGLEAYNHAAEVKVRAERKAGEMLAQLERSPGGQPTHSNMERVEISEYAEVLQEQKIPTTTAFRWQKLAEIPEVIFEKRLEEEHGERPITTSGILQEKKRNEIYEEKLKPKIMTGKYQVIYADPPWSYNNSGFDQSAASQYPTMTIEEIKLLPVNSICQNDSVLFLWATSPLLPEALEVIKEWGFQYKASMIWVKNKAPTIGWWVNTKHELLLIASKDINHPIKKFDSVFYADVKQHSQKPEYVYEMIEEMYHGSKIELFARNKRDKWTVWGNEI